MRRRDRSGASSHEADPGATNRRSAGKRALTDRLPVQRKTAQEPPAPRQRHDGADFDRPGEYMESRATVDGVPTSSRLTDAQLRKARQRNPHWQNKLGFSTSLFGGGEVASGELAENVAAKQVALGLAVDGIAGPETVDAVIGAASAADPFGVHLLGPAVRRGAGAAGRRDRRGEGRRDQAASAAIEQRLQCEVTDLQPKGDGVQLVIGAGAIDGVDESWHVHVLGSELRWKIAEVRQNATVVISHRGHIDDVRGLNLVDLRGVPRADELSAPPAEEASTVTDATEADDVPWWTFED